MVQNNPSFWSSGRGVLVRWLAFGPLFVLLWIVGGLLFVCAGIYVEDTHWSLIKVVVALGLSPFVLGILLGWAGSVIALPCMITTKPKISCIVLTIVFLTASMLPSISARQKGSADWGVCLASYLFILVVLVGASSVFIRGKGRSTRDGNESSSGCST
jgi:hypothetical protein